MLLVTPAAALLINDLTAQPLAPLRVRAIRFDIQARIGSLVMQRASEAQPDDEIVMRDAARVYLSPAAGSRLTRSTLDTQTDRSGHPRFLVIP